MATRRTFIKSFGAAAAVTSMNSGMLAAETGRPRFTPWTPGTLDIHHISTGRGNSTLCICPDGTSILIDAGAVYLPLKYTISPKPDGWRMPGEWIARYVTRHMKATGRSEIDYFLPTHFHSDHIGEASTERPLSADGSYRLTGIMEVAETVRIHTIIDRGYPAYDYPKKDTGADALNYVAFAHSQAAKGVKLEQFVPGSNEQVQLLFNKPLYPGFSVRNLAANGAVWTGSGEECKQHFPPVATLSPSAYPTENMCSLALRMDYGKFKYFTAGDMEGDTLYGKSPWRDIETPTGQAAGRVDVAVATHHGFVNAMQPGIVSALRPRTWIIPAWHATHPVISTLDNMLSRELYPGDRDIFATAVKEENKIVTRKLERLKSDNGHIVVRVAEGGESYRVVILDNADESDTVLAEHGPFVCGG